MTLKPGIRLPFIFDLRAEKNQYIVTIVNAQERIELRNVLVRNDSLFISFPAYDSDIRASILSRSRLNGSWYNRAKKDNYALGFDASINGLPRFALSPSSMNVSGRWEVTFEDNGDPYKAVGIFEDHGREGATPGHVSGTFLTETGDYRYLEGGVSNDSLYLSTFDGSHAFYFNAKLVRDTLFGSFFSGSHYQTNWCAVKNEVYSLPHPDSLTYLVSKDPVSFTLPGIDGVEYTYPNNSTRGKVTLIQIMGTWCPNCLDESIYLSGLKRRFGQDVEIIAVSFETPVSFEDKVKRVNTYRTALDLNYPFVVGGDANKNQAHELFPMLNGILSFPTLIFIDKKGGVRKIHTGFNGPGTGIYYDNFFTETTSFVESLIKE